MPWKALMLIFTAGAAALVALGVYTLTVLLGPFISSDHILNAMVFLVTIGPCILATTIAASVLVVIGSAISERRR